MKLAIFQMISGLVGDYIGSKRKVVEASAQAKADRVKHHINGLADDVLIFVWSYPFASIFVPGLSVHTVNAFEQLQMLPDWYIAGFMTITASVFGFNRFSSLRSFNERK